MRIQARRMCGIVLIAATISGFHFASAQEPNNAGPAKLLTASWLGGFGDDELVAAAIAPDMTIVLAGNTVDLPMPGVKANVLGPAGTLDKEAVDPKKKGQKWVHPSTHGFIVRLSIDGQKVLSFTHFGHGMATIRKLHLDDREKSSSWATPPRISIWARAPRRRGRLLPG